VAVDTMVNTLVSIKVALHRARLLLGQVDHLRMLPTAQIKSVTFKSSVGLSDWGSLVSVSRNTVWSHNTYTHAYNSKKGV